MSHITSYVTFKNTIVHKKNNISWRHHYLPVFYLKGFTKESGMIKIFDVEKKKFVQNGKEFSPESYFFQKKGNTIIDQDNVESDFLENDYSHFDNNIAKLISKINLSDYTAKHNVSENDMPVLNHFVSLMYWRLPHRKDELKSIIGNNELQNLGLSVHNKDGSINKESGEELKKRPGFLTIFKFYNSLMDSVRGIDCRTPYSILEKYHELPYLCSDNPVIFEKDFCPNVHEDDYIFPLSGTRIFLRASRQEKFDNYMWMLVDMLVYKQAVKFVSCTHEKYIEILENNFEKYGFTVQELKAEIFKKIR